MVKKSAKARRRDNQPAPVCGAIVSEPGQPAEAQGLVRQKDAEGVEVRGAAPEQDSASPSSPSPVSVEVLAAHDSFVRSPSAVIESLRIRMTPAVARRLGSTPPLPPIVRSEISPEA